MDKRYYGAGDLERSFVAFERRFGMGSEAFIAAYLADDEEALAGIPNFMRHSWASFYLDWKRMRGDDGDDFGANIERQLELA